MSANGLGFSAFWATAKVMPKVTLEWLYITVVDALPLLLKRMVLSRRLSGPRLERRLSGRAADGFRMFKALLRIAQVSSAPVVQSGHTIPRCLVYNGGLQFDLKSWYPDGANSTSPVVLNFGSCS